MTAKRSGPARSGAAQKSGEVVSAEVAADLYYNMPVGVYVYELENPEDDRSLRLIAANPASATLTGVRVEDIVGCYIDDCFPGLRAKGVPQRYAEVICKGVPTELESFRYRDERVAEKVFAVKAFPLPEERIGISFEDITEHCRVESTLRLTQFAVDRIADAIFWMKPDAGFIYVNNAACHSLGYSREELLSMRLFDIDPSMTQERWEACWRKIRKCNSLTRESIHRCKDGREFPVEISINYLNWEGREYDFCFVRNITERRKAEKEIRATNEQLRLERVALEEKNIAMREVLDRIEEEKQSTREQIRVNVEEAILPLLSKLRQRSDSGQRELLELVEQQLREIASPFLDSLKSRFSRLTAREQEICLLIRAGHRSKEIADLLGVSLLTIHKHREKIRRKLDLCNSRVNLSSFLKSL